MTINSFDNLPPLTKEEALEILSMKIEDLELSSDYYKATFHLLKFPGSDTEQALLSLIHSKNNEQPVKIARRKAVEVLARLNCRDAIPTIGKCLGSDDPYLVENAAWALQKLQCNNYKLHEKIASLLADSRQNRRVLVQSLSRMGSPSYIPALKALLSRKELPIGVRGAAIAATLRLSKCSEHIEQLKLHLYLPNQNDRQCAIQDVIDSELIDMLPSALKSPVAPSFRLNAINQMWPTDVNEVNGIGLITTLDSLINGHPDNLILPSNQNVTSSSKSLIEGLFHPDFAQASLSLKILIDNSNPLDYGSIIFNQLERVKKDYGAIYFLMILFRSLQGWESDLIKNIEDLGFFCLDNRWPDFMKFRPVAILTLAKLCPTACLTSISDWLDQSITPYWVSRYAALMSIEMLSRTELSDQFYQNVLDSCEDSHRFVRAKALTLL